MDNLHCRVPINTLNLRHLQICQRLQSTIQLDIHLSNQEIIRPEEKQLRCTAPTKTHLHTVLRKNLTRTPRIWDVVGVHNNNLLILHSNPESTELLPIQRQLFPLRSNSLTHTLVFRHKPNSQMLHTQCNRALTLLAIPLMQPTKRQHPQQTFNIPTNNQLSQLLLLVASP